MALSKIIIDCFRASGNTDCAKPTLLFAPPNMPLAGVQMLSLCPNLRVRRRRLENFVDSPKLNVIIGKTLVQTHIALS